ncbi:hypothetical protein MNBD_CHLOROFLEXI01-2329, partial [hydrothermal vent metagenome]
GMFVVSWLVQPGWLLEWLNVRGKTEATSITPTLWGLASEIAPQWWVLLGLGFVVLVTAVLGLIIFRNPNLSEKEVLPLVLIASLLTTPYAWVYEHLLLLIPSILIFLAIKQRGLASFVWLLLAFVLPWGTFWLAESRSSDTFTVLVPLLIGLFFYFFIIAKPAKQAQ